MTVYRRVKRTRILLLFFVGHFPVMPLSFIATVIATVIARYSLRAKFSEILCDNWSRRTCILESRVEHLVNGDGSFFDGLGQLKLRSHSLNQS